MKVNKELIFSRRNFLTITSIAPVGLWLVPNPLFSQKNTTNPELDQPIGPDLQFAPIKQIEAGVLNIGYYEAGSTNGPTVILLHGFPYSILTLTSS